MAAVQAAGYRYVTLDLEGLRSGQPQPGPARTRTGLTQRPAHQSSVPGAPLNGPTTIEVIQPP